MVRIHWVAAVALVVSHVPPAVGQSLPGGPTAPPKQWGQDAPTRLVAAAIHHGRVELTWFEAIDHDTGFEIERRTASGSFALIGTAPANATSFVDTTTAPSTTYAWRVRATLPTGVSGWSIPARATTTANRKPRLQSTLPAGVEVKLAAFPAIDGVSFDLIATDPDGDRVTIEPASHLQGLVVASLHDAPSPATLHVEWNAPGTTYIAYSEFSERVLLEFVAHDDVDPSATTRLTQRFGTANDIDGDPTSTLSADVTGDGRLDLIVLASYADIGPDVDAGALYVWAGGTTIQSAPSATLVPPAGFANATLGTQALEGVSLEDVTGDGILDLIASCPFADANGINESGAVFVFQGGPGLVGTVTPLATFTDPGSPSYGRIGEGPGTVCTDLDGDGITDLLIGGEATGELLFFRGGASLVGTPVADATFGPFDITIKKFNQRPRGVELIDLTGDGRREVIVSAAEQDNPGITNGGAILVWDGAQLTGAPLPLATLYLSTVQSSDRLGDSLHTLPLFADVTGDGYVDVISAARYADLGSKTDAGAAAVWAGGPALSGNRSETALLVRAGPKSGDEFGSDVAIADLSGDGIPDVLVGSTKMDSNGLVDNGGVLVYLGGATLAGTPAPWSKLLDASGTSGDQMHLTQLADLNRDGIVDAVLSGAYADVGGVADAGAATVWIGGASLAGNPTPSATLTVAAPAPFDAITFLDRPLDFDGDGDLELWALSDNVVVGGLASAGALLVFEPGTGGWSGAVHEIALLTEPIPTLASRFAALLSNRRFGDVTGDGSADLVIAHRDATRSGQTLAGVVYVFAGGKPLSGAVTPTAELDMYKLHKNSRCGNQLELVDLDGDGILDVVAGAYESVHNGIDNAGNAYLWYGGARMSGVLTSDVRFGLSYATRTDSLTYTGITYLDLDGDGRLDVFPHGSNIDWQGVVDSGALPCWKLPFSLDRDPDFTLAVPGAMAFDKLGYGY